MVSDIRNVKRKNHEVSKCLLHNWLDSSANPPRVHYFDLRDHQQKFEVGKQAKFATTDYIYTPLIRSDDRDSSFEDWLSVDESGLGLLAKAAHHGSPDLMPSDSKNMSRAIRACIALGCRSAYSFAMIAKIPQLADMLEVDTCHQALIKNAMNILRAKYIQFSNWDFSIFYNLPDSLIINEQPFRDWTLRPDSSPWVSMPLAPNALLSGQPPKEPERSEMRVAWVRAPDQGSLVDQHNKFVVNTARQWVAADSARTISEFGPELSEERDRQRRATDRHVLI